MKNILVLLVAIIIASLAKAQKINPFESISNPLYNSDALESSFPNSPNENKILLDSTYLVYFHSPSDIARTVRKYFKYDDRGNQVLSVEYDGEHTSLTNFNTCEGCMGASFKTELKFDEGNHISERIAFICNPETKQWVKYRKSFNSYDLNGRMTSYISYYLNDNGLWGEPGKTDLSYNEHGDLTSFISMLHDSITNKWINYRKNEYMYESNKRRTEYNWNNQTSQWDNSTKEELEYDASGNDTLRTFYNWDKQTSQWIGFFKYKYAYSKEGKLTNTTDIKRDTITNQWINVDKTDYIFDTNGNEIEELYSEWDATAGKWFGRQKYVSTYHEKGQLSSKITYLGWNKTDATFDLSSKEEYEYDSNGNNTTVSSYYWNLTENLWSIRTKTNNFYSLHDLTNKVEIKENMNIRLYPNPVDETLTLDINDHSVTQCHLYNSNGQLLLTLNVEQGINTYNISHLNQGMYLLKLKTEEGLLVKKIIKK